MKYIINGCIYLLLLVILSSCKIGKIGDFSQLKPDNDVHMHGPGSKPTSHTHYHNSHPHTHPCEYQGKRYTSTKFCGYEYNHMHGPDSEPHAHLVQDRKHGTGFQCKHKGTENTYPSDSDCGLHIHKHVHGLTITQTDPHGIYTKPHEHHHEHTGEHGHDHNNNKYYCYTNNGKFLSYKDCDFSHKHAHMHSSKKPAHTHIHNHQKYHNHRVYKSCIGYGDDHNYYPVNAGQCSDQHMHKIVTGYNKKPVLNSHFHRQKTKDFRAIESHKYTCSYKGKTYPSNDVCIKPHSHKHSHNDKTTRQRTDHEHEHEVRSTNTHHIPSEETKEARELINKLVRQ